MTPRCKPSRHAHPLCRPGRASCGTVHQRLRPDGRWVRDNGDPGLAFVGLAADATDADGATIWVANCKCAVYLDCPVSRALAFAANRYGSATVVRRRRSPKLPHKVARKSKNKSKR